MSSTVFTKSFSRQIEGEFSDDPFTCGRYATDASIYQIMPIGVVVPKSVADVEATIAFAREAGHSVLPRGGGTSQCGQTVNSSLVVDTSKHLNKIIDLDVSGRRCVVQPGIVLDDLNRALKPHGLWFPVDVSTASRATLGGMAANNSCGGRSLRYGTMRDNVASISGFMADGQRLRFAEGTIDGGAGHLEQELLSLGQREAPEVAARFPDLLRRVGGYNLDALAPEASPNNFAHLLVGSEGTLSFFTEIELELSPLPGRSALGICHFASFAQAMDAAQHLVTLGPQAVELIDDTMIDLGRKNPAFRRTVDAVLTGNPAALLLVEFAEGEHNKNLAKIEMLKEMMDDFGYSPRGEGQFSEACVAVTDPRQLSDIAEFRKAGLNIMMSMKDEGKPVSFVEDCAVQLPDLAGYTAGLSEIFERHGTRGTWYAHASVGCLHVRPILNLKLEKDVNAMRAIAEECFELVRSYKGSHSGEHGDGIARSEFHEKMFGSRIVKAFEDIKTLFDPTCLFNPERIVNPPRMDDLNLLRYGPDYGVDEFETQLDWSEFPGAAGGFQGAVEMCNNNGACRKMKGGVMCPSFRVTRNEIDSVRGRANSLRLAISGQVGKDAITSQAMSETLKLCVSCKACKSECPTGVDMARMKIEVLAARRKKYGLTLHDRIIGFLPRYSRYLAMFPALANVREHVPGVPTLVERLTGFSRNRALPKYSRNPFRSDEFADTDPDVVIFADVFNRYFEPDNLRAAGRILRTAGLRVTVAKPRVGNRNLDCGRSLLAIGAVAEARSEAKRLLDALLPHVRAGRAIIGIEPSSLLTLRDEIPAMIPGEDSKMVARSVQLFEEFFVRNAATSALPMQSISKSILLHGHCHQKAYSEMTWVQRALARIPEADVTQIETSCCGMAGAFGYHKDTAGLSLKMGELNLFPEVRGAPDSLILADGFSCRHQILEGTGRRAVHVAIALEMALLTLEPKQT